MDAPKDVGGDEFHRGVHGGRERELEKRRRRRRKAKMEGAWLVKVEQQNLNSRQRRRISRGLRRLIARAREETIGVLEELKDEIRAEWVKANARSTGAQRCKSSSEEECLEAMA